MKTIELKDVQMKELPDYIGVPMLISSLFLNVAKLLTEINFNFWIILITSICGLAYIIYKLVHVRKEVIKTDLEIANQELMRQKTQLEIDQLNKI